MFLIRIFCAILSVKLYFSIIRNSYRNDRKQSKLTPYLFEIVKNIIYLILYLLKRWPVSLPNIPAGNHHVIPATEK